MNFYFQFFSFETTRFISEGNCHQIIKNFSLTFEFLFKNITQIFLNSFSQFIVSIVKLILSKNDRNILLFCIDKTISMKIIVSERQKKKKQFIKNTFDK